MIDRQPFGRTGHDSTRIIFGAAALWSASNEEETQPVLEVLLRHGVNHIDTAAIYGRSERRVGEWMQRHRDDFFLATKTIERTSEKAWAQFQHSLERMGVDRVDLLQLHNLVDEDEWQTAMAPGGALEAAVRARDEGLARFIGVTGHGVSVAAMHRRSLERFPFDSVLLPYNYTMMQNPAYAADFEALTALCAERGVAVQTIKSLTLAPWGEREHTHMTWYEPFTEQADIDLAVRYVLARPDVFLNTAGDPTLLGPTLEAASRAGAAMPAEPEMSEMAERRRMEPLFT
jgi:aryl-alcohol dehydrogenase-like predicted oxidoreductase